MKFCCCFKNKNNSSPELKITEEIHQYVPFQDVIVNGDAYQEAIKLKNKLHGYHREKK
jgi:hypothetical protein